MGQKYGQHFLHDQTVLSRIAQRIDELAEHHQCSTLLEIGPGRGALTKYLLDMPYSLLLSEIDTTLTPLLTKLTAPHDATLVRGDILHMLTPEGRLGEISLSETITLAVGNLPYYITSPILRLLFTAHGFPAGVFLIQYDVAEKIRRDATKKSYLRWLLQRTHQVTLDFVVQAASFSPPPKVVSAVVYVEKLASPRLHKEAEPRLLTFLDLASPYKRKTLGKIAKIHTQEFEDHGFFISESIRLKRLEDLSREDMSLILGVS